MEGKKCLEVVSLAPSGACTGLLLCLARLGYEVIRVDTSEWLQREDSDPACPLVFCCWTRRITSAALETALRRCRGRAVLGVFPLEDPGWAGGTTARFSDFVLWPCHERELEFRLKRIAGHECEALQGVDEVRLREEFLGLNLVGRSPAFVDVLARIKKLTRCEAPVLLEGETGTGKELAAQAIHYLGARRGFPFIPVNCGAIPDSLFENELFGHNKGAFTDAGTAHDGLVAQAEGGTLFLDEVQNLSPKGQAGLLRFLQDEEYKPLGGRQQLKADVQVIAASNSRLNHSVSEGAFRQDLLFRLNVVTLRIPPLRERLEDIELLAETFASKFSAKYGKPRMALHPEAVERLKCRSWRGNIRELENVMHRAVLMSDGPLVDIPGEDDGAQLVPTASREQSTPVLGDFSRAKAEAVAEFEVRYLRWVLAETRGNITLAAKRVGKERRSLGKLLKKHGIEREQYMPAVINE